MPADPNWLYSTIAQSSAALVAIVGGFVLSRLLSLATERNATEMRLAEVRAELQPKQREFERLCDERLRQDVYEQLLETSVLDALIKRKGDVAVAEAIEMASFRRYPPEELRPVWDEITTTTQALAASITHYARELPFEDEQLIDFLQQHGIEATAFAKKIYYAYLVEESHRRRPPERNHLTSFAALQADTESRIPARLLYDRKAENETRQRREQKDRDIVGLRAEIAPLEQKEKDLKTRLVIFEHPKGIMPSIIVLVVFACVGIVAPILMLPVSTENFNPVDRWVVVGLFMLGLGLFFGYLIRLTRDV